MESLNRSQRVQVQDSNQTVPIQAVGVESDVRVAKWRVAPPSAKAILDVRMTDFLLSVRWGLIISVSLAILGPIVVEAAGLWELARTLLFVAGCGAVVTLAVGYCLQVGSIRFRQRKSLDQEFGATAMVVFDTQGFGYGEDIGKIVFVEGWLVFEGQSTTFSVLAGDVAQFWEGTDRVGKRYVLCFRDAPVRATVIFFEERFEEMNPSNAFYDWMRRPSYPVGRTVLPPLEPMPSFGWTKSIGPMPQIARRLTIHLIAYAVAVGIYAVLIELLLVPYPLKESLLAIGALTPWIIYRLVGRNRAYRELASCRVRLSAKQDSAT